MEEGASYSILVIREDITATADPSPPPPVTDVVIDGPTRPTGNEHMKHHPLDPSPYDSV